MRKQYRNNYTASAIDKNIQYALNRKSANNRKSRSVICKLNVQAL